MNASTSNTSNMDSPETSVSVPPKPATKRFVVRVEINPQRFTQAVLTDKDENVVMYVPFGRIACRMQRRERVAFFQAEIEGDDTFHIGDRAPVEKHWLTMEERGMMLNEAPATATEMPVADVERCPCGAPRHKSMCRDALAAMNGRRSALWRAPGM